MEDDWDIPDFGSERTNHFLESQSRYHIGHADKGVMDMKGRKELAFKRAIELATKYNLYIWVFDSMAHEGKVCKWVVRPGSRYHESMGD